MRHLWALRWRRRGGVRRRPRRGSWALGSGRSTTSRGRAAGTGRGAGGRRRRSGARQRWGIQPGEGLPSVLPSFTRVAWQAIEVGWNCRRLGLLLFCSCSEHALAQLKFWASSTTGCCSTVNFWSEAEKPRACLMKRLDQVTSTNAWHCLLCTVDKTTSCKRNEMVKRQALKPSF